MRNFAQLFTRFVCIGIGMVEYLENLISLFRNKTLNIAGVERDFISLINDGDIEQAISLMQENNEEVNIALTEYYPEKHKVMKRPNKLRKRQTPYISAKLPRKRQQFINEIALFFLLNNPVKFRCVSQDTDEEYKLFCDFLRESRFDAKTRQAKRIAGAETESAKLYRVYRDEEGNPQCSVIVLSRSNGYQLRTLIDQYNQMEAFAYGYNTKSRGKVVQHWDIQTKDVIFNCTKQNVGWQVEAFPNPLNKIGIIYYRQPKEWEGVQPLCDREEDIISRGADNNNYFSDPIAKASADVIKSIVDPNAIGKFIQVSGDHSSFEYITPPQPATGWKDEKEDLSKAILTDSFTPDFSFEGMRGFGTLTGAALRNSLVIGYVKRNKNIEIYGEGISREINLIIAFLKIKYPTMKWDKLQVEYEFADPFTDDKQTLWSAIASAKSAGIMSTETAVSMAGVSDDYQKEIDLIHREQTKPVTQEST